MSYDASYMNIALTIISIVVSALGGGACGSVITGRREKRQRRAAFLGFLRQWQVELSLPDRGPTSLSFRTDSAIVLYDSKLPAFSAEVERARDVFPDAEKFQALTDRLRKLTPEDWKGKQPRQVISEALDELIAFVSQC